MWFSYPLKVLLDLSTVAVAENSNRSWVKIQSARTPIYDMRSSETGEKQLKPALLIVDMQNDFVLPDAPAVIAGAYATVPRIREILGYFRQANLPVFHIIRSYFSDGSNIEITRRNAFLSRPYAVPGTRGAEIIDGLTPVEGEIVITKPRFSGFFGTNLEKRLKGLGISQVVICGTQYPNCIRATAFDAISCDFSTTVITDATSAATEEVAKANIHDMQYIGIHCLSFKGWVDRQKTARSDA